MIQGIKFYKILYINNFGKVDEMRDFIKKINYQHQLEKSQRNLSMLISIEKI